MDALELKSGNWMVVAWDPGLVSGPGRVWQIPERLIYVNTCAPVIRLWPQQRAHASTKLDFFKGKRPD